MGHDGTLVDTEPYWIQAEHELVAAYGGEWNDEFAHQLVGNALEVSAQLIIEKSGISLSVPEIVDALLGRVIAQVERRVPWRPGARELLLELGALGVPSLLVTMSWRSLADMVVRRLPEGAFEHLVTGDEVSHASRTRSPTSRPRASSGRPRRLHRDRGLPAGVRSATAAGVPTIAIPHVVPVPPISGAVHIDTLAGVGAADLTRIVSGVRSPR